MGHGEGQGEGKGQGQGTGSGKGENGFICVFICVGIFVVILVLALIGLNITKIVMGAIYLDDCPLERLIPIYLIVSGCASFLMGGLQQVVMKKKDDVEEKTLKECINVGSIIGAIGLLFNFAWLICGSVWIFGNYQEAIDGCGGSNDCCHEKLIKFAFAVTIVDWVIYALILIAIPVIVCCIVCGLIKKNKV